MFGVHHPIEPQLRDLRAPALSHRGTRDRARYRAPASAIVPPGPPPRLLVVVQLDSAAAVGGVATDRSSRRGAAVSTCAPARRPKRTSVGRKQSARVSRFARATSQRAVGRIGARPASLLLSREEHCSLSPARDTAALAGTERRVVARAGRDADARLREAYLRGRSSCGSVCKPDLLDDGCVVRQVFSAGHIVDFYRERGVVVSQQI